MKGFHQAMTEQELEEIVTAEHLNNEKSRLEAEVDKIFYEKHRDLDKVEIP